MYVFVFGPLLNLFQLLTPLADDVISNIEDQNGHFR